MSPAFLILIVVNGLVLCSVLILNHGKKLVHVRNKDDSGSSVFGHVFFAVVFNQNFIQPLIIESFIEAEETIYNK